ncbi:sensor histidine kinase [Novosphingobium album (ex Liu et al. 2023)]|uniref:histidine kinase n=1 Tax=Novosphingobium album (ex Liu et al. 2023) TaxID=3031130 RepID=A0ABT5WVS4_9SPHN|nr:ATP-binding protein [Novosphingobium album (ex Liu et al. 2023)]MDE8654015.1 ATP-binding protein [Novosphingobium album (ex Liu et al. 2023)]
MPIEIALPGLLLIVADADGDAAFLRDRLVTGGAGQVAVRHTATRAAAPRLLRQQGFDGVVLDLGSPASADLADLAVIVAQAGQAPVIVIANAVDPALSRQLREAGAAEVLDRAEIAQSLFPRLVARIIRDPHAQAAEVELERQMESRTGDLVAANRDLEAFAYSVSHDLRAPLRAIEWLAQSVLRDEAPSLAPVVAERLAMIGRSVDQMNDLIEDHLALARIGRHKLRRGTVDTPGLVADILRDLRHANADIDFHVELGDLPDLRADPTLVRLVFQNLLENAVKFSRLRDRPEIQVGTLPVAAAPHGPPVYYVRDNGVGFDMRFADRLFDAFQRLHARQAFDGSGIGLAIVQRIVDRHGGRIWAESSVDAGATFYFTLDKTPHGVAVTHYAGSRR